MISFPSVGGAGVVEMAFKLQKAFRASQYAKTVSFKSVQREFRNGYRRDPPQWKSIYAWYKQFETKGHICKRKSPGLPHVNDVVYD
jgi:hypothetical protein